jgi:hypothetical protein
LPALLTAVCTGCSLASAGVHHEPPFRVLSITLPSTVAGYEVAAEPKASRLLAQGGPDSYLDAGEVFSFRQNTVLFATLEVGELVADSSWRSSAFHDQVVAQIGTAIMEPRRVAATTVYVGEGNRQRIYCWFTGRLMHLLLTHDIDDPTPLLQELLRYP